MIEVIQQMDEKWAVKWMNLNHNHTIEIKQPRQLIKRLEDPSHWIVSAASPSSDNLMKFNIFEYFDEKSWDFKSDYGLFQDIGHYNSLSLED